MGTQPKEWREYRRLVALGDFHVALRVARAYGLPPLTLKDALDLTLLAAQKQDHVFDAMAVRWIVKVHERGTLKLHEVRWLADRFREVWGGDQASPYELTRFLGTGKRL